MSSKGMSKQRDVRAKGSQGEGRPEKWDVKAKGCQSKGMSEQRDAKAKGCQSKGMHKMLCFAGKSRVPEDGWGSLSRTVAKHARLHRDHGRIGRVVALPFQASSCST